MTPTKRLFDVAASLGGLIVLSPLLGLIALTVWLSDRGPPFYADERVGLRGKPFRMWKFRTMVVDAHLRGGHLTVGGDVRITPLGTLLRKTKLDELPQLWNVLMGEMSLVGPRPEVRRYVELYDAEQRRVLDLPPGITDPASIEFRDEEEVLTRFKDPEEAYVTEIMPRKIRINLEYAASATVLADLAVVLRTLARVTWPAPRA